MKRRHGIAGLVLLFAAAQSFAQDVASFPARPVRLVIPFAPGGTADSVGRIVADKLAGRLGKPVVLDTRPGANSVIGCNIVAQASPDGHTRRILAPGKTPRPILDRLNTELNEVLADAETRKRLAQAGIEPTPGSPADFAALIKAEVPKWAKVLKLAGIEPE